MIELPLVNGGVAILSDRDGDLLWTSGWRRTAGSPANGGGYAILQRGRHRSIVLHRLILERMLGRPIRRGEIADHINRDRLDCRRENLRMASWSQNMQNRPYASGEVGYRGVYFMRDHGRRKRYGARIRSDRRERNLGYFMTAEEAARAYDAAARELHGEFATLNFPDA